LITRVNWRKIQPRLLFFMPEVAKPKLLVVELWGLGDLVLAIPFLQAATQKYDVTLLAKPYGQTLRPQFFPSAKAIGFIAPWTAFRHKYRLFSWPWPELLDLRRLRKESFGFGVSARWDPRDHFLLRLLCKGQRLGFPRRGSQVLLTHPLEMPEPPAHRYDYWRSLGRALNLDLPSRKNIRMSPAATGNEIVVHTGGSQKTKIWPLDRYRNLVARLRGAGYQVRVVCDPNQADWWRSAGDAGIAVPGSVADLFATMQSAGAFIGNDSGPGHVAALIGVPTFTLFGSGLSEWFSPLHPDAQWLDGSPCRYKPCRDYCRFPVPNCLWDLDEQTVVSRVEQFVAKHIAKPSAASSSCLRVGHS
jgi:ADP-heptose:LPS heptosyltransferase